MKILFNKGSAESGIVQIEFNSIEELERIVDSIKEGHRCRGCDRRIYDNREFCCVECARMYR